MTTTTSSPSRPPSWPEGRVPPALLPHLRRARDLADRPYGVEAILRDSSGNWLVLVEPKSFSPEDFQPG